MLELGKFLAGGCLGPLLRRSQKPQTLIYMMSSHNIDHVIIAIQNTHLCSNRSCSREDFTSDTLLIFELLISVIGELSSLMTISIRLLINAGSGVL